MHLNIEDFKGKAIRSLDISSSDSRLSMHSGLKKAPSERKGPIIPHGLHGLVRLYPICPGLVPAKASYYYLYSLLSPRPPMIFCLSPQSIR